jgi:hypothetical protein
VSRPGALTANPFQAMVYNNIIEMSMPVFINIHFDSLRAEADSEPSRTGARSYQFYP